MANCFLYQEEKFIHDNAGRYTIEKWFNNRGTTHDSFEGNRMEKKNSSYSILLWVCHKVTLMYMLIFFTHDCSKHIQIQLNILAK